MKRLNIYILASVVFLGSVLFLSGIVLGCKKPAAQQADTLQVYSYFKDVPGITNEEIKAIEALAEQNRVFIYGMPLSTEAFLDENNEIGGFSALFCRWLSDLFNLDIKCSIYELSDILSGLENKTIDFTGELRATDERRNIYYMTDPIGIRIINDSFPAVFSPVSLATQNPELQPIIDVVQKILENGGFSHLAKLYDLGYDEYLKNSFYMQLSEEEKVFIRDRSVIPIAAEHYNYPVAFYNRYEKQWQGIFFDVLDEISGLTGLSFTLVNDEKTEWPALLNLLETGKASMIAELLPSQERQGRFLWPKTATVTDNYALLSKSETRNFNVNEILGLRVGVAKGTAFAELFKNWFPDHGNITEYGSSDEAFKALDRGEIDVVMSNQRRLLALSNYYEYSSYKANFVFNYPSSSYIGLNKEEAILCSIIDKTFRLIDIEGIANQWMNKTLDYKALTAHAQRPWLIGMSALLLCVLVLLFVMFQIKHYEGKRLEDLVQKRTSDLKTFQQNLEYALDEAHEANKAKSKFLANMSHEIRTPMNAILGITEILLRDRSLKSDTMEALGKIYTSGDLLLGIINDILDFSKIEAGRLELTPAEYKIASLINDTVTLNLMRLGSKHIEFKLFVDENLPAVLIGDELRIKQILNNLLSNSFKYTEEGEIKFSVTFEPGNEEEKIIVYNVSDTGQGMTEEQLNKLFEEYMRFNLDTNRSIEGTGLGLTITKSLIHMMNADITVKSEESKGSLFTVRIPQKFVGSEVLGKEVAENLQNFRITGEETMKRAQIVFEPMPYGSVLVVDDVESNLYVAKGIMMPYGLSIETATNGLEAIEKIKEGKVYDLVFMDHMMPKMDGIEAVKIIREYGYTEPIVALTANAVIGQSDIFMENGFDGFISKPIDVRQLNLMLKKYVRDKQHPEVIEAALKNAENFAGSSAEKAGMSSTDPQLADLFLRDIRRACATLEAIHEKRDSYGDEDITLYITTVHGLKGILANMGELELSAFAAKLEKSGREKNTAVMSAETPDLLSKMNLITEKLNIIINENNDNETPLTEELRLLLRNKMLVIKEACTAFDQKTARETVKELRQTKWPAEINELLGTLAEDLLGGDFNAVSGSADKIIETI
jgi:signal transduction histidine kinase/DNA-binding response OmpR family regulator